MNSPFDHERIRRDVDRSWTRALLEALADPAVPSGEAKEVAETLCELEDPGSWGPLLDLFEHRAHDEGRRRLAGRVLSRSETFEADGGRLRSWWTSGDAVLQRVALAAMGPEFAAEVEHAASDPAHPFHLEGIQALTYRFDRPRFQPPKVRALSHPDPEVRIAAARAIFWDEPLAAEVPLREALHDPDPRVARAAADTLRYYPSLGTWRALEEARSHPDPDVAEQASESAEDIRDDFRSWTTTAKERARTHVRRWLEPIWAELAFEERDLVPVRTSSPGREVPEEAPSVAWLLERLDDPRAFGEFRASSCRVDWLRYGPAERAILSTRLAKHADPCVRQVATWAFHAWGDQEALFGLVRDPARP